MCIRDRGHLPIEDSNGDAPENAALASVIEQMSIPVIVANQCINGPVDLNVYSKGRNQQKLGVLGHASNASPEALLVKSSLGAFKQQRNGNIVRRPVW